MSPEVMNVDHAYPASDIWGIGVITYQLLSGGISPFFAVNRFRTMSKINDVDYSLDQAELCKTSDEAKDFISRLLVRDPKQRLSATQCLQHKWLKDEKLYLGKNYLAALFYLIRFILFFVHNNEGFITLLKLWMEEKFWLWNRCNNKKRFLFFT